LGVGDRYYRLEFTQIGSSTWKKVSMGQCFTLATLNDNTLWGWGDNYYSQLGNQSGDDEYSPIKISDDEWNDVSAGADFSIALKQDNTLW
jgi:alpha-tubulin suppressor-like RCC1 family protein